MIVRMPAALALMVSAIAAVTLGACGESSLHGDVPARHDLNPVRATGPCHVTSPNGKGPASSDGFNHGNDALAVALWPKGRLVAGRLPDGSAYADIKPDGSIVAKLGWWRAAEGPLAIHGQRLDGRSRSLRAEVPKGYGTGGFQPSVLTFPTPGCWKVAGNIGHANLTFVVLVTKR
jgi:hypothetical protein